MANSIELELQTFPKTVALKDATKATLRPLHKADERDFHQLFLGIPNRNGCSSSIASRTQATAMKMFAMLGFSELMRQEDYVKDMQAISHDYILMGLDLRTDEEYVSAAG
ncbi:MAG TPA: hypothetical protein VIK35_03630 [Verrucomicrobiae bacterium]